MNTLQHKIHDVVAILRETWLIILFLLIGAFAFMQVEQGQDMLFAIIDDFDKWPFSLSLLALAMWAMQTAFGARITLIFSDLSFYPKRPEGLTTEEGVLFDAEVDERVNRRKRLASLIPKILFAGPYVIMIAGYVKAFATYSRTDNWWHFILCIVLTIISGVIFYKLSYAFYRRAFASKQTEQEKNKANKLQRASTLKELGNLRTTFFLAVSSAGVLALIYSFLSIACMQFFGAVHLITLSFGCWIGISCWIDYLDRNRKLFLKPLLFIYVCVISYYNHDHPVRIKDNKATEQRASLTDYFDTWYATQHFSDSIETPVFFVSAEGGASRSGYWVTRVLATLQDKDSTFKDHIFSYSSVSGGTLGVNAFNAICKYKETHPEDSSSYAELSDVFYTEDFLAPVTGRFAFGDLLNLFTPSMFECFDRAGILERTWEKSFREVTLEHSNLMEESFSTVNAKGAAVFVNTTEVETGSRALLSNVMIDTVNFTDVIDVQDKLRAQVRYSTAILFSARFPYLSPAGAIQREDEADSLRRHYVDGGYFENMGNITTMEVMGAVKQYCAATGKRIKPVVLLLTNDGPDGKMKTVRFANELLEPLDAFMNVRSGHTWFAYSEMKKFVLTPAINGEIINFNMGLGGREVPMNWFMSNGTKGRVNALFDEPEYLTHQNRVLNLLGH
jgi:hypothetical protein